MIVTVIDRALQGRLWGNGYHSIRQVIKQVEIGNKCPVCGEPRGEPKMKSYCEDDEWYRVSNWDNPCGHLDKYSEVLKEAAALTAEARQRAG